GILYSQSRCLNCLVMPFLFTFYIAICNDGDGLLSISRILKLHLPITGKPTEVRMGRGKGNHAGWIARVSTGQIPFEMDGVSL
nr:ribosomal protein L16, mitochondrial [Tanacetum cinerariifolium]